MNTIEAPPTIEVNELIMDRIQQILDTAEEYGLEDIVKEHLTINSSENRDKIEYSLMVPKANFKEFPNFYMKLYEKAYASSWSLSTTHLKSYSYHGFHTEKAEDSKIHFIRFDFEPFKEKYAPVHINAYKQIWGDHLVYPDSTNLNISKMCFRIALHIFNRYAKDKLDHPVNKQTNQNYVEIIANGGAK